MHISRNTILLIALGIIVLAAVGYLIFGRSDSSPAVSLTTPSQNEAETTFVNLTAQINGLQFDTSILTDPRFKSLIDIHTEIIPEAKGRKDPFAPFSGVPTK